MGVRISWTKSLESVALKILEFLCSSPGFTRGSISSKPALHTALFFHQISWTANTRSQGGGKKHCRALFAYIRYLLHGFLLERLSTSSLYHITLAGRVVDVDTWHFQHRAGLRHIRFLYSLKPLVRGYRLASMLYLILSFYSEGAFLPALNQMIPHTSATLKGVEMSFAFALGCRQQVLVVGSEASNAIIIQLDKCSDGAVEHAPSNGNTLFWTSDYFASMDDMALDRFQFVHQLMLT